MISKPVVLGLMAAASVTAAAGGAYVAVRHNAASPSVTAAPAPASAPTPAAPVAESEAVVAPPKVVEPEIAAPARRPVARPEAAVSGRVARRNAAPRTRPAEPTIDRSATRPTESAPEAAPLPPAREPAHTASAAAAPPLPEAAPREPAPPVRQFVEVVIPASSVVALRVETPVTSEMARIEDRVEARVTRDVIADGRVAIPAGARAIGDVVEVDRGGKMKGKARLGVRFHTLVFADGSQLSLRTDPILREGSSPGNESARKIGGAAIGGAVLGAIMGGAKGAAIGGATGAAGGSAVVMAGDRNHATLPAGTVVTVRLNSPVSIDVEKDPH
jgi:type IV secretory pathway VirB10-like protein